MRASLTVAAIAFALAVLLLAHPAAAAREQPRATVYFLVNSEACPCQRELCEHAEPVAAWIRNHLAEGVGYERLDYAEDEGEVKPLMQKHRLFAFPVILVLDQKGEELLKARGPIERDEVLSKLKEIGIITETGQ